MELWLENDLCTGCAACENICSSNAISLKPDEDGFLHPVIDQGKCVNCGKCSAVCPVEKRLNNQPNAIPPRMEAPDVYAAWSKDESTRFHSTSGGVFSEIARVMLARGANISGAIYSLPDLFVKHTIVNDEAGLEKIRQSKYVQSEIGRTYRLIRERLRKKQEVLFCGAPCQVAGLYDFLGGDNGCLTTVDFICRGVNSPFAYRAWLDGLEAEYGSPAIRVWFKNKEKGWNHFSTRVDFANGRMYRKSRYEDLFMRSYLEQNLFIRPACTQCRFKGMPRTGDITLADFWKVDKRYDADRGTSMVIINSEKGAKLLAEAEPALTLHKRSFAEALEGNPCLKTSAHTGKNSKVFLELLHNRVSFSRAFKTIAGELQPLVSIIIPMMHRNSRLAECIKSICRQNYQRLDMILIRASDDAITVETCKKAAVLDPRIRYITVTGDMNFVRNEGLQNAKGEYIHFCSGAEVLEEGFYATLVERMENSRADVACFGYRNAPGKEQCKNAFTGTGNAYAFMDLLLTSAGPASDYTGYGTRLENKLFRRDAVFLDETPVLFEPYEYDMTETFWLLSVAFLCHNALFISDALLRGYSCEAAVKARTNMVLYRFFEKQDEVLESVEEVLDGHVYNRLLRLCFEYELALMVSAREATLTHLHVQLREHLIHFHQVPWTANEKLDTFYQNAQLKKDRQFLKKKVDTLEKELSGLKNNKFVKIALKCQCAYQKIRGITKRHS